MQEFYTVYQNLVNRSIRKYYLLGELAKPLFKNERTQIIKPKVLKWQSNIMIPVRE